MQTIYHKLPATVPEKCIEQLRKLETMQDEDIDYSDIPPLNPRLVPSLDKKTTTQKFQRVLLSLPAETFRKYQALGRGYASVMSRVLCEYVQ